uniref:Uncharacterized protein n=1 Tax=Rhizophora mucronata TaxID=61149 RepID=A0A2P2NS43_RHIMU
MGVAADTAASLDQKPERNFCFIL